MSDILPLRPGHGSMPESSIEFPTAHPYSEQDSLVAAEFRFGRLANNVPELQQEHVRIEQGATDLIRKFQIGSAFFDDPRKSLIFYSLALKNQRFHEVSGRPDADGSRLRAEQGMVVAGTFLLAADHSHAFKNEFEEYISQLGLSEGLRARQAREDAAITKFEDRGLTADIQHYVDCTDALTETKQRLLVDPMSNETNLEMHAVPLGDPNWALFEAAGKKGGPAAYIAWAKDLRTKVAQFEAESGIPHVSNINGFAAKREDRRLMVFSSASAQALLRSKNSGNRLSIAAEQEVLQAEHLIRHEYVHTVGSVGLGPAVGKSLEEIRADHFSAVPVGIMGYMRLGNFFKDLCSLYGPGTYIGQMYDGVRDANAQGVGTNIYEAVANAYGLEVMAEIALLAPTGAPRSSNRLLEVDMQKSLGGFGGVLARAAMNPRVDRRAAAERALEMYYRHRELIATRPTANPEFERLFLASQYGSLLGALGLKHHMDELGL
ncbi:MAG TPA: hypothetical protein VLA92_00515 [Candidatus Saccharimonadales bacterium]|nr:hypothetical protein [Candidatus Saccharimonadales bacterium]